MTTASFPRFPGAKSICACGHTGDGPGGDHGDEAKGPGNLFSPRAPGHGACARCDCRQFTWDRWVPDYERMLDAHHARQQTVKRRRGSR